MYSRNAGAVESARKELDDMPMRNNVVAATATVKAFLSAGDLISVRQIFNSTVDRDVMWNTVLSGYARCGDMASAGELFARMPDPDVMSWNTVLLGYANPGDLRACEDLFDKMPKRNVFSWNSLIGGYACLGQFSDALGAFRRMLLGLPDVMPNDATLAAIFSTGSKLGALK